MIFCFFDFRDKITGGINRVKVVFGEQRKQVGERGVSVRLPITSQKILSKAQEKKICTF